MSVPKAIAAGVIGALGLAGGFAAVALSPWSVTSPLHSITTTVQPEAVHRNLDCAGGVVGHLRDGADATVIGNTTLTVSGGEVSASLRTVKGKNGSVISYTNDPQRFAASESTGVNTDGASGFLAAECGDGTNEQWLVGGSTTTGRDTIITITNGSQVEAHVDIEVWGSSGSVDAPGSRGIVIPPLSQRSYSAAGFTPGDESPVFHIVSTGAAVWSTLETSVVRGLLPGGLDRTGPAPAASTESVFPVVRIPEEKAMGAISSDPDYADVLPVLRLLVPGTDAADVSIVLDPLDGGDPHTVTANVPAGRVMDLPLSDLTAGDYAITVTGSVPFVSGVRTGWHDSKTKRTDMAWLSSVPAVTGIVSMSLPVSGTLSLSNPGTENATVTVTTASKSLDYTVAAHSSTSITAPAGIVTVESGTRISASAFLQTNEGIAAIRALSPPAGIANVAIVAY